MKKKIYIVVVILPYTSACDTLLSSYSCDIDDDAIIPFL
jgi:hypothetical protein